MDGLSNYVQFNLIWWNDSSTLCNIMDCKVGHFIKLIISKFFDKISSQINKNSKLFINSYWYSNDYKESISYITHCNQIMQIETTFELQYRLVCNFSSLVSSRVCFVYQQKVLNKIWMTMTGIAGTTDNNKAWTRAIIFDATRFSSFYENIYVIASRNAWMWAYWVHMGDEHRARVVWINKFWWIVYKSIDWIINITNSVTRRILVYSNKRVYY